jgi:hypothetical protein
MDKKINSLKIPKTHSQRVYLELFKISVESLVKQYGNMAVLVQAPHAGLKSLIL